MSSTMSCDESKDFNRTEFREIVHPVWQADQFDIGKTKRQLLDNYTKKNTFITSSS